MKVNTHRQQSLPSTTPRILLLGDPPSKAGVAGDFGRALAAWAEARGYSFDEVIVDESAVNPCTGCLTCYRSDEGVCVQPDGYGALRDRARRADYIVLFTEITYGQPSVAIKQLIDKGIGVPWGFCGPFPIQFVVGFGEDLAADEEACFLDIVRRHMGKAEELHRQLKGSTVEARIIVKLGDIESVIHDLGSLTGTEPREGRSVCLLNGSLRGRSSTSRFLLDSLEERLGTSNLMVTREELSLTVLKNGLDDLATRVLRSDALVIALPLFCYSLPAGLLRLLVQLGRRPPSGRPLELFAIVYSGSAVPNVNDEALRVLRLVAKKNGWAWGGGLAVESGLMFKLLAGLPFMGLRLDGAISALSRAIRGGALGPRSDMMVEPPIPRFVTDLVRNSLDRSAARRARRLRPSRVVPSTIILRN